jgi:hypothetical protein
VLSSEDRKSFADRCKTDTIVLYDGGSETDSTDTAKIQSRGSNAVVSTLMARLKKDGCRVSYLSDGFSTFSTSYSHLCAGSEALRFDHPDQTRDNTTTTLGLANLRLVDERLEPPNIADCKATERGHTPANGFPFPVQVLPFLFLGNAKNAADKHCLTSHGIKYVLNVTPDIPNAFIDDEAFSYMQIPITDHWSQNLNRHFSAAIAFIDEGRDGEHGVLVHCLAGISRSVTVTVAYLMAKLALPLNDAYEFLRRCKPNISPNFNFMGQLMDFEATLRQRMACSCGSSSSGVGEQQATPIDSSSSSSCSVCQSTKTYFSSPADVSTVVLIQSPARKIRTPLALTMSSALSSTSSSTSSSSMSLSSLTLDST